MDAEKRRNLEAEGWQVGSAEEFLGLAPAEALYIEIRFALAARLRASRQEQHITQAEVARRLGSSQSRVAKMEIGDPSVSLDLIIRSLLTLGASSKDVAAAILAA